MQLFIQVFIYLNDYNRSSFFDYNEYVSLREAITRMKNTPDNTEIPVTIQGKVD